MIKTYSYAKAKQNFDRVLDKVLHDGKVLIRKNDQLYTITHEANVSPLDVEGVNMGVTVKDILACIHESRKF
jgi:hypothetical protein